jgi:hypothetical protein
MALITYDDKNNTDPLGSTDRTFSAADANEIKDVVNENATLTNWNMSLNLFPSGSTRGKRYYGINGPTSTLFDRLGSIIPNGVFITSLVDSASTTVATDWAIEYTII